MKTLHFVVRVTVQDNVPIAKVAHYLTDLLEDAGWSTPQVWRPRGDLGVLLRWLDEKET